MLKISYRCVYVYVCNLHHTCITLQPSLQKTQRPNLYHLGAKNKAKRTYLNQVLKTRPTGILMSQSTALHILAVELLTFSLQQPQRKS